MNRFVKCMAFAGFFVFLAERRRRQHAERTREHSCNVGENVAKKIVGHNNIELLGRAHQLHAAGIGQHMFKRYILIVLVMDICNDFVPENTGFHDIVFFKRSHFVFAGARKVESNPCNAVDLVGVVNLGINCAFLPMVEFDNFLRLAEIDATRELAYNQNIKSVN